MNFINLKVEKNSISRPTDPTTRRSSGLNVGPTGKPTTYLTVKYVSEDGGLSRKVEAYV